MAAFWSGSGAAFLASPPDAILDRLTSAQARSFRTNPLEQLRAWLRTIELLRDTFAALPQTAAWQVVLEYQLLRLGRRIDAVLVTPRAVLVLEFKAGAGGLTAAGREQVEDYALDLWDFHGAGHACPIVPILVATDAAVGRQSLPLLIASVTPVLDASAATLAGLLAELDRALPAPAVPLSPAAWEHQPYRPVPTIIEAARSLYRRHSVAELAAARADTDNLARTTDAILTAIAEARTQGGHVAIFVTGIPGAGKTLCGLNAVLGAGRDNAALGAGPGSAALGAGPGNAALGAGPGSAALGAGPGNAALGAGPGNAALGAGPGAGAVFLTGNPALVHVLREALARDAAEGVRSRLRAARQRMEGQIQALPHFRDAAIATGHTPPEHVAVIDEAQRCWSRAHAVAKTRDRRIRLTDSEPGHLLDIMARQAGWAAVVCLIGGGQEIHTGEGGLAEWGAALGARPQWRAVAAPPSGEGIQRLPPLPGLRLEPALHLAVPIRAIRGPQSAPWVDAVLAGDAAAARGIAAAGVPFLLTRDLEALRAGLRALARGSRRAGLVASSAAARLRACGLGVELPHMDAGAVARWFLDRWPDVRAADALETVATEFSCQGLELDVVGLCWDGDLVPRPGGWVVRSFRGTAWQVVRAPEAITYRINTYRVLLTRARYETILFVPRGAADDATRDARTLDAIAAFLLACGARVLEVAAAEPAREGPMLL